MALDFPNSPTVGQIFTAAGMSWNWDGVKWMASSSGGGYLPLSGGTLSGPLTVTGTTTLQGNEIFNGSATFAASATFQQPMTVNALATFSSGISVTGVGINVTSGGITVTGAVAVKGAGEGFVAFDRGNSGGTTANGFTMYRDVNVGRLFMAEYGDAIQINTAGTVIHTGATTLSGNTTINGATPLTVTSNGSNYPILAHTPPSQHCVLYQSVDSVRGWLTGPFTDGTYWIYDNSVGGRFRIDTAGNTLLANAGGTVYAGSTGLWNSGCTVNISPNPGTSTGHACYCGAAGGNASLDRVDTTLAALTYFYYGTTGVGYIATNGSNTSYLTSCDARLKDNIRSLESEIDVGGLIDALRPAAFEWKPKEFMTPDEPSITDIDGKVTRDLVPGHLVQMEAFTDHGFIAQELQEVVPSIVFSLPDHEMAADYSKMMPYVIAELQALRKRVAELEGS